MAPAQINRFLRKLIKTDSCWEWDAFVQENGYGQHSFGRKTILAHRASYQLFKGELLPDMQIDHTCNNRKCVNPDHLEQVTASENTKRMYQRGQEPRGAVDFQKNKTHCQRGHAYNEENTYWRPDRVGRGCRQCIKIASTAYLKRREV